MKRRAARVMLVLVCAGVAGAAAWQAIARSHALEASAERRAALVAAAARADLALVELAAAQRGYVAPGQGIDFWIRKTDETLASARAALGLLTVETSDPRASAEASAVHTRLDDFMVVDARARAYAESGQRGAAADLIFADGFEILAAARAELAAALSLEQTAATAPAVLDRQMQLAAIGVLGVIAAVALLLLMRAPKEPEALVTSLGGADFTPAFAPDASQGSDERAVPDDIGAALDASLAGLDDLASASSASPVLPALADVCVDLARLLDARDLDTVLARGASVLGAGGLIVWMADETGQSMTPALTHGYPSSLVARLGRLATGDDNATAAAWRLQGVQVVDGALAVPLLTNHGCTGVLAIEFRDGREHGADTQALARIIAAQLAATISPAPAESRRVADG